MGMFACRAFAFTLAVPLTVAFTIHALGIHALGIHALGIHALGIPALGIPALTIPCIAIPPRAMLAFVLPMPLGPAPPARSR
jgi:hypothetical protein